MQESEALALFERHQALVRDSHIVYTSGKHGRHYVNKDAVYPHTADISRLCQAMARAYAGQGIDTVLGPVLGGVILSTWTAWHLSQIEGRNVVGVYAEKASNGGFQLTRGYDAWVRGKRVLLVEDVINTGGSIAQAAQCAVAAGATVVGAAALCNRGNVKAEELGVPRLHSLMHLSFEAWDASDCPLCQQKVPINTVVGKGREFLAKQKT